MAERGSMVERVVAFEFLIFDEPARPVEKRNTSETKKQSAGNVSMRCQWRGCRALLKERRKAGDEEE